MVVSALAGGERLRFGLLAGAAIVNLTVLYGVQRGVATSKVSSVYERPVPLYQEALGDWHEPLEGAWDVPLGQVNGHARAARLAADLRRGDRQPPPGGKFRAARPPASAGRRASPPRPGKGDDRLLVWMGFVNLAHRAAWPKPCRGSPEYYPRRRASRQPSGRNRSQEATASPDAHRSISR